MELQETFSREKSSWKFWKDKESQTYSLQLYFKNSFQHGRFFVSFKFSFLIIASANTSRKTFLEKYFWQSPYLSLREPNIKPNNISSFSLKVDN